MMSSEVQASTLFATSQGAKQEGGERCHWCCGPCTKDFPHDDVPYSPFSRSAERPRNPSGRFVCVGCRLYRRPSVTVWWLSGGYGDRQCLKRLSWWMTGEGVRAVRPGEDSKELWKLLLAPPVTFCLALHSGSKDAKVQLHQSVVNDYSEIKAETPLVYTLDNAVLEYTVYELYQSCKHEVEGKSPGVQALHRVLGRHVIVDDRPHVGKRGRPPKDETDDVKRVINRKD